MPRHAEVSGKRESFQRVGVHWFLDSRSPGGPLACQLVARQLAKDGSTLQIEQGYAMGRPSLIRVHVSGTAVQVSGSAFISGRGNLRVE